MTGGTHFTPLAPGLPQELVELSRGVASSYFLPGEPDRGRDELRQVALIGVWQATRSHRPELGTLYSFARLVIERRLKERVTAANRQKRLHDRDALQPITVDGELASIADIVADPRGDVVDRVADRMELARIRARLPALTRRERTVLIGSAVGLAYEEMFDAADRHSRKAAFSSVDNAYARARRKLVA